MNQNNNPESIAIILDGNRRYAKKKGLKSLQGHKFGAEKVRDIIEWCGDLGIKELTLYSFSVDNFDSSEGEKKTLFLLFGEYIKKLKNDERLDKNGIRVRFIGRLQMFPENIQKEMHEVMEKTKNNDKFKLNFAMAYSSKAEITDALKKIIQKLKNNEFFVQRYNSSAVDSELYSPRKQFEIAHSLKIRTIRDNTINFPHFTCFSRDMKIMFLRLMYFSWPCDLA